MDCERIRELLLLDVSDDLEPEEAGIVSAHLAGCASCREERKRVASVFGAFAEGAGPPMPQRLRAGFWAEIRHQLREEGVIHAVPARTRWTRYVRPALAAAVLAGAFALGWFLDATSPAPGIPDETAGAGDPGSEVRPATTGTEAPVTFVRTAPATEFSLPNGLPERRIRAGEEVYLERVGFGSRRPARDVEYSIEDAAPRGPEQRDLEF